MRLIIVANRAPYYVRKWKDQAKCEKSPGGLVSALDPAIKKTNGIWVCTGESLFEKYEMTPPYEIHQVKLTNFEERHYYEGFCNKQIWPIFHYFPGRYRLHEKDWFYYKKVNHKLTNKLLEIIKPGDKIWIQDYHLMLLPTMLRENGIKNKIGFFLHIPFPNREVFKIIPRRNEILEGLLGCDLIGFHTESYKKHFIDCVKYYMYINNKNIDQGIINYNDSAIKIISLPISIDFKVIDETAKLKKVAQKVKRLRDTINAPIIGLGVDRLDYTKGIVERLEGLEYFFDRNPEYIKKITFIQLSVPTRSSIQEYKSIKTELEQTVGRINGKFSKDGWSPICYIYNSVSFVDLIAYYQAADFLIVSALRDGLNLVAKEYIASKINNDGMLILSEFTGAAEELNTGNMINPYDVKSISSAILKFVNMDQEEKEKIMRDLRTHVEINNVYKWVDDFLKEL